MITMDRSHVTETFYNLSEVHMYVWNVKNQWVYSLICQLHSYLGESTVAFPPEDFIVTCTEVQLARVAHKVMSLCFCITETMWLPNTYTIMLILINICVNST